MHGEAREEGPSGFIFRADGEREWICVDRWSPDLTLLGNITVAVKIPLMPQGVEHEPTLRDNITRSSEGSTVLLVIRQTVVQRAL